MFDAYSEVTGTIVNVKDAFNLKEVFRCPNPLCTAKFTIHSANGKRAKHFSRLPSTSHTTNCPFANGNEKYLRDDGIVKCSIDTIFYGKIRPELEATTTGRICNNGNDSESNKIVFVRTPSQLLNFCMTNPLTREYLSGKTVDDIILDSRNLVSQGRFRGVSGLRFIVGTTLGSKSRDTMYIRVQALSKHKKNVTLYAAAKMENAMLLELQRYLINTYGSCVGQKVAILGDWSVDREYWVSCVVQNKKHIIFNF